MIELLDLKEKVLKIFETDIDNLGSALMKAVANNDVKKLDEYMSATEGDLTKDYLQMIFQYYHADRKEKMQDYTPTNLAQFVAMLTGDNSEIVDLCAGSGALTIQMWVKNPNVIFRLYELDEKVIPYLLFNLVVRNIKASVCRSDVLQFEVYEQWTIQKGEKYGKLSCVKSTI